MKLRYYPETDSLYIELSAGTGVEVREIDDGSTPISMPRGGWSASTSTMPRRISISKLETVSLPQMRLKAA